MIDCTISLWVGAKKTSEQTGADSGQRGMPSSAKAAGCLSSVLGDASPKRNNNNTKKEGHNSSSTREYLPRHETSTFLYASSFSWFTYSQNKFHNIRKKPSSTITRSPSTSREELGNVVSSSRSSSTFSFPNP